MKFSQFLSLLFLSATSACFGSDGFFSSLELGFTEQSFYPSLVGPLGAASYKDGGRGLELGVVGGYDFSVTEEFSVAALARGTYNAAEWDYTLAAEPATFRYAIPFTLGVGLQPRFEVVESVSLFAEGGVQWGYVRQRKNGPLTDGYDVNEWRLGYVAGGGVDIDIADAWSVRFNYRHVWYDAYSFQSVTALGVPIWNVEDQPQSNSVSLAAVFRF